MATDEMVIILSITKSIYSVIPKTVKKCGYLIHVVLLYYRLVTGLAHMMGGLTTQERNVMQSNS